MIDRNAAIAKLLATYPDQAISRRAKHAERDLRRYCAAGWRFERALLRLAESSSQRRRMQHEFLKLTGGSVLGWRQLLRLASQIVENKAASAFSAFDDNDTTGRFDASIGEKSRD